MARTVPILSMWSVLLYISVNKRDVFIYNLYLTIAHKNDLCLLYKYCKNNVLFFTAAITLLIFLGQIVPPSNIYL